MNLLFIEPDERFFEWIAEAIKPTHECARAANVDDAEDMIQMRKFDACFVDIAAQAEEPSVTLARTRSAMNGTPLIILTGKEVRADLFKICDGFIYKAALTHPDTEIPSAVRNVIYGKQHRNPMDSTLQLFNALSSLRLSA
jgi:DNA-binding NarL/FixJ family response regulator